MSAALKPIELPREAMDLIREGTPKPKADVHQLPEPPVEKPTVENVPSEQGKGEEGTAVGAVAPTGSAEPGRRPKAKAPLTKEPSTPERAETLVSMTFRLPVEIPAALVKASADRKVRRERPYTQQEMVARALSEWLEKSGYL